MSLQSQLNKAAFEQLSKSYSAINNAKNGNVRGSMEQITLRELSNCRPCLDDMTQEQKDMLDSSIIDIFNFRGYNE